MGLVTRRRLQGRKAHDYFRLNDQAQAMAQTMLRERALPDGGFRHDASDPAGPYLGDTLAMGQGFLALFEATGERAWLHRAWAAADFIDVHFRAKGRPGYLTTVPHSVLEAVSTIDENIALTRYFNLLARYGGRAQDRNRAEQAMKWLATPEIALSRLTDAGILHAAFEIANDPVHLTVVGERSDPAAQSLHTAALAYPAAYRRIDWWAPSEGPMDNPDVQYPALPQAAAFACGEGRCSLPAFDRKTLTTLADRLSGIASASAAK